MTLHGNHPSEPAGGESDGAHSGGNGLHALAYVPLTDIDPATGRHLLGALGRARIAAYLDADPAGSPDRVRLFVAAEERGDARTIVAAAVRGLGGSTPAVPADPLAGVDTDAAFRALVAGWHVDTTAVIRAAERDLTREDADWRSRLNRPPAPDPSADRPAGAIKGADAADPAEGADGADDADAVWLDDDHYVPPPAPPLPRLAGPTILAMTVLVLSVLLLGLGGQLGLADDFTLVMGIGGLVLAAVILFTRVREYRRDEDDDGSAI